MKNKSFWEKKKILITGASGFIGKNFVESLLRKKTKVFVYVRNKNLFISSLMSKDQIDLITVVEGKITDLKKLSSMIDRFSIQHIVHLAANNENRVLNYSPYEIINANLNGSITIMEASLNKESIKNSTKKY